MKKIYLDNNATTGMDPRVIDAMREELSSIPANPSSSHFFGQEARKKLLHVRTEIAAFFSVPEKEILFTSGGTESLNMILRGLKQKGHIISSNVEHSAVYHTLKELEAKGYSVTFLEAGLLGAVTPEAVEQAIRSDTVLIMLTAANNETGVKTDIESIASIASRAKVPFAVDGVSLLGKEPVALPRGVSAICFSAHKLHGPKGVGFTLLRPSLSLHPLITGGDQEYSLRAGTENLPGIIGLAKAIALLRDELPEGSQRMLSLRNRLESGLQEKLGSVLINGEGPRLVNTANLSFPGLDGETLLLLLDRAGIAVSHGSACASGALEPSRVLLQMGISKERARSSLRFSLSRWTTAEEIDHCIAVLTDIAGKMRAL